MTDGPFGGGFKFIPGVDRRGLRALPEGAEDACLGRGGWAHGQRCLGTQPRPLPAPKVLETPEKAILHNFSPKGGVTPCPPGVGQI